MFARLTAVNLLSVFTLTGPLISRELELKVIVLMTFLVLLVVAVLGTCALAIPSQGDGEGKEYRNPLLHRCSASTCCHSSRHCCYGGMFCCESIVTGGWKKPAIWC